MGLVVSGAIAAAPLVEREEELRRLEADAAEKRISHRPPVVSYYRQGVYSPKKGTRSVSKETDKSSAKRFNVILCHFKFFSTFTSGGE